MAKKTKNENKKVKLWVRLGGYIELTPEEALQTSNGELSNEQIESIIKRGFEVNGDCYAPGDSLPTEFGCYDLELGSLGPFTLKFTGDKAPTK